MVRPGLQPGVQALIIRGFLLRLKRLPESGMDVIGKPTGIAAQAQVELNQIRSGRARQIPNVRAAVGRDPPGPGSKGAPERGS